MPANVKKYGEIALVVLVVVYAINHVKFLGDAVSATR
jgi:hypothetical protein